MDIMELGAIGELVGGAAVLVTLIYLAVQVQMTRASIKATAELDAARSYEAIIRDATDHGHWVMSPGNVPIFEKGLWVEILPRRDLLQGLQHGRVGDRHLVHAIELRLDGELRARDVGFRTVADLPRQVDERRHHSDRPAHFAHRSDCFPVHDPMSPAAGSHAETDTGVFRSSASNHFWIGSEYVSRARFHQDWVPE